MLEAFSGIGELQVDVRWMTFFNFSKRSEVIAKARGMSVASYCSPNTIRAKAGAHKKIRA